MNKKIFFSNKCDIIMMELLQYLYILAFLYIVFTHNKYLA